MILDEQVISLKEAIFWIMGVVAFGTFRFLSWAMPKTAAIFYEHIKKLFIQEIIKETKDLNQKVQTLTEEVISYKSRAHKVKNDRDLFLRAIIDNDQDAMRIIRESHEKK